MLEVNRHENIEIFSYSEVTEVNGYVGNYEITITKHPRFVTNDCNGCGACAEICPIFTPNYFDENLGARKSIDIAFGQAVPFLYDASLSRVIYFFSPQG